MITAGLAPRPPEPAMSLMMDAGEIDRSSTIRARHWHALDDGRIECDVCPRRCKLHDGQRGFCFIRARLGDELVLTSYGRSSGFAIDPIEKKPLFHFLPGTSILSFGTAGCNLGCRFCQNWDVSQARDSDRLTAHASPESIARIANATGCQSVAFTFNDPVVFLEYAVDSARACHDLGLAAVAVTAGWILPEARSDLFRWMDAANVDLKAFTEGFYRRLCGGSLAPVLETLVWIRKKTSVWLEITTLLIPGENDSDEEIEALSRWVVDSLGPDVPLHFTGFHPDDKMRGTSSTAPSALTRARRIAKRTGVRHAYTGNVDDPEGESTYCASCFELLIGRAGHAMTQWNLTPLGGCPACGEILPGRFEVRPGSWGDRVEGVPQRELVR